MQKRLAPNGRESGHQAISHIDETSGLGKQSFHGRVVVLVNEHTTGAAEMLAQFVQENGLGTIVGSKTPGRLVSRSAFKIGHDYRIVIPIGAYVSWKGNRIEGKG